MVSIYIVFWFKLLIAFTICIKAVIGSKSERLELFLLDSWLICICFIYTKFSFLFIKMRSIGIYSYGYD